jgi:uncharacterized cupin superfamily protein
MDAVNIFSVENVQGRVDVARAVGSSATAMFIYDLEPGESSSPYHYEYEEEWLLVVDGTIVVRIPDGERTLERGDLVRFPAGPAGAHKVMNRSESPARMLMFSSSRVPAVSVYPDSDKLGVWPGDELDSLIFKRGTAVPWSEGVEGWEKATCRGSCARPGVSPAARVGGAFTTAGRRSASYRPGHGASTSVAPARRSG